MFVDIVNVFVMFLVLLVEYTLLLLLLLLFAESETVTLAVIKLENIFPILIGLQATDIPTIVKLLNRKSKI